MQRLEEHCWSCSCTRGRDKNDPKISLWLASRIGEAMSSLNSLITLAYSTLASSEGRSLIRRSLVLFTVGVFLALVLNLLQVQRHVTLFPEEVIATIFSSAWWVPPCCGTAAAVVGLLYPCIDSHLGEPHKFKREWASVMRCIAVFVGINHASAKLDFANNVQLSLTLAALSLGLWWTFDRSRSGLGLGITIAFLATLITQFLVYNGVYQFLATGQSYASLNHYFLLGISTISEIVHDTCLAIWEELCPAVMPLPDGNMWRRIANGFWNRANFPNCIGALDGKHIRMQKPPCSGSRFHNYKKYFSLVLMAICDSNYKFIAVDIGGYGSSSDSRVFRESVIGRRLRLGQFNLPSDEPLPGTEGPDLPFVLVADEAFALSHYLLRPYARNNLDDKKRIFNYRLSRARRLIECSFGILSSKWRVFQTPMQLSLENAELVIKACIILHNIIRDKEGIHVEEEEEFHLPSIQCSSVRASSSYIGIREKFADFFLSPSGEVPWQYQCI